MRNFLSFLLSNIRFLDVVDVALVSILMYRLLLLIQGTRAVQVLTGLGILGLAFVLSIRLELFTLHWVLSYFFDSLILIVIVLFQDDIRLALAHVGKNPFFPAVSSREHEMVDELVKATSRLARIRLGGLIVIERETGLKNIVDTGSRIDSSVKADLIHSIFLSQSPIHDGAILLRKGRIEAAGCFLPLSKNPNIEKNLGSRHRAALGISEETDAIVLLVSEETGGVHLVQDGRIYENLSEEQLGSKLEQLLELQPL